MDTPRCSPRSRRRAAGVSACSRTRAGSASSAPTPARPPASSCPTLAEAHRRGGSASCCPPRRASRNPVDMLGSATAADLRDGARRVLADPRHRRGDRRSSSPAGDGQRGGGRPRRSPRAGVGRRRRQACAGRRRHAPTGIARDAARGRDPGRAVHLPGVWRPGRSAGLPSAPTGSAGRSARCRTLDGIDGEAAAALVDRRSRWPTIAGSTRPRRARCCSPTAFRSCRSAWPRPRRKRPRPHASWASRSVVKTPQPGAHKTELGGVALDLEDEAAVRAAAERIGRSGDRPAHGRPAAPSCSPAWCRTPSSGLSSPSAPAACWPS